MSTLERRYQKGPLRKDTAEPGLIQKPDDTVWLVNPDGSETQITGGGGGGSGAGLPVFNVTDPAYGAVSGGAAATNSAAFQAAIDAAGALSGNSPWVWVPNGTYAFDTTLRMKSGVTLMGPGLQGDGPILSWVGPGTDHAVVSNTIDISKIRICGLRFDDDRVAPTLGDMIHVNATNGTIIEHVTCSSQTGAPIYVGLPDPAITDNYIVRHVWVGGKTYGVVCENLCENVLLVDIKGDAGAIPFDSLIYLTGTGGTGFSNHVILSAKVELGGSAPPGTRPKVLRIGPTFDGTVFAAGLHMGENGGYVIYNESPYAHVTADGLGTLGSILGMVRDSDGTIYGDGTTQRVIPHIRLGTPGMASYEMGAVAEKVTNTAVGLTLNGTHRTVLVAPAGSDRTFLLPTPPTLANGRKFTFKKTDASAGKVIINPNASVLEAIHTPVERYAAALVGEGATSTFSPVSTIKAGTCAFLLAAAGAGKTIASVSDNAGGNTWVVDKIATNGTQSVSIVSCQVATDIDPAKVITVTWSTATSGDADVWVQEVAGMKTSGVFDTFATATGTGTVVSAGPSATLAQANELVWGLFWQANVAAFQKGSSYTYPTTTFLDHSGIEWKIVSATTAVTADGTYASSGAWAGLVAAYKGVETTKPAQIEGASTLQLTALGDKATVVCDGANWWSV